MRSLVLRGIALALIGGLALAAPANASAAPAGTSAAPSTARPVLLGKHNLFGQFGRGWGTAHPKRIDNGGDPSGIAYKITWKHWGAARSGGTGLTYAPKPTGGFYARPVKIQLHASGIGRCTAGGPRVYTRLLARAQKKPGGAWTPLFRWAGLKSLCSDRFSG